MIYDIKRTTQFKKDVKLMLKQGKDIEALLEVVELLRTDAPLPDRVVTMRSQGAGSGNGNPTSIPTGF